MAKSKSLYEEKLPPGFEDMMNFGLIEALLNRRSRRFFVGAEIPDGVFKFKSRHKPMPLSDLEKMLVISACGGNTSWHNMIYRGDPYAPHLSNYAGDRDKDGSLDLQNVINNQKTVLSKILQRENSEKNRSISTSPSLSAVCLSLV